MCMTSWAQIKWDEPNKIIEVTQDTPEIFEGFFSFENTGDHLIEISDVKVECGCTKVEMKKKIFVPGEKGEVPFKIFLKGKAHSFTKSLTVFTNKETVKSKTLTFTFSYPDTLQKSASIDGDESDKEELPKIRLLKAQTKCPFQGTDIKKELYVDYGDQRIYTCCKECIALVEAQPELAIKNLENLGEYPISVKRVMEKLKK